MTESKATAIQMAGVHQIPVPGFDPKEAISFIGKQGIDPSAAPLELVAMSIKFGGHPLMLKAICQLLPRRPTGVQVRTATEDLPSATSVAPFLADLSNKVFFNLIRTNEQRKVVSRLAILTSHFDKRIAFAVAAVKPSVPFSSTDWMLLHSTILDAAGPDRYLIPPVLKHIGEDALDPVVSRTDILVAAAKTFLTPKAPTQPLDFIDFQSAIFAFLAAKKFQTAAYVLGSAIPTLLSIAEYSQLEMLFLILNAPTMQNNLKDHMLRWRLLVGEGMFLIKDRVALAGARPSQLLRQMRSIAVQQGKMKWFFNITLLGIASSLRGLRINVASPPRNALRLIAPILTAIRIAIKHGAKEQIASLAKVISNVMRWAPLADIAVLDAIAPLLPHIVAAGFPPNRVVDLYMRVTFSPEKGGGHHKGTLLRHAAQFESDGFLFGYVAAMYAVAHIDQEYESNYAAARAIAEDLLRKLSKFDQRHALVARIWMLIGDTYWKEKRYADSAASYSAALNGHNIKIVRESALFRLLDCWIALKQFDAATARIVNELCRRHRTFEAKSKTQLYGRLVYAYAKDGRLMKAAIACDALDRVARLSGMDHLRRLSLLVSVWALGHFHFDDVALPQPPPISLESSEISDQPTDLQLEEWRKGDPFATKARLQISAMFELLGRYKKAYVLIRDSLKAGQGNPAPETYLHVVGIRAARLVLLLGDVKTAAARFRDLLQLEVTPSEAPRDIRLYVMWRSFEPILGHLSDQQLMAFSDELFVIVSESPGLQAAVRLHEGRALFDRLLVQKGKRYFGDAESLANRGKAEFTLLWVLKEKLFLRAQQMARDWDSWATALARATLLLWQDFISDPVRQDFVSTAQAFIEQHPSRLQQILQQRDNQNAGETSQNLTRALLQFATERGLSGSVFEELASQQ